MTTTTATGHDRAAPVRAVGIAGMLALWAVMAGCVDADEPFPPFSADDDDDDDTLDITEPCQDWTARYDFGVGANDLGGGAVLDPAGRVFATARSIDGEADFVTMGYGLDGNQLWATRLSLAKEVLRDVPKDIEVDPIHERVFVSGEGVLEVDQDTDCVVVAYEAGSGEEAWRVTYTSEDGGGVDMCKHSGLDDSGRLHVAGITQGTPDRPATSFVFALDHEGDMIRENLDIDVEERGTLPYDMAVGGDGGLFVTGQVDPPSTEDTTWIAHVDASGEQAWWRTFPGGTHQVGHIRIGLGAGGGLFQGRATRDVDGPWEVHLTSLDPDGETRWSVDLDAGWSDSSGFLALAADGSGGVYWTTAETTDDGTTECVIHHHDATGTPMWERFVQLDGSDCRPMDLVVDGQQRLTLSGSMISPAGSRYFLHGLDGQTGEAAWTELGETDGKWGEINNLALDDEGNLVASGTEALPDEPADAITLKRCAGAP